MTLRISGAQPKLARSPMFSRGRLADDSAVAGATAIPLLSRGPGCAMAAAIARVIAACALALAMATVPSAHAGAQAAVGPSAGDRFSDLDDQTLIAVYLECIDTDCVSLVEEIERRGPSTAPLLTAIVVDGPTEAMSSARATAVTALHDLTQHYYESSHGFSVIPVLPDDLTAAELEDYRWTSVLRAATALVRLDAPDTASALATASAAAREAGRPYVADRLDSLRAGLGPSHAQGDGSMASRRPRLILAALAVVTLVLLALTLLSGPPRLTDGRGEGPDTPSSGGRGSPSGDTEADDLAEDDGLRVSVVPREPAMADEERERYRSMLLEALKSDDVEYGEIFEDESEVLIRGVRLVKKTQR